jgi:hypothetical protein
MKFFSTLFCTIVLLLQANAQDKFVKGHYVNNHGDTVRGMLGYRGVYRKDVSFRTGPKEPVQNLTTKEVASFGFDSGSIYVRYNHPAKENLAGDSIFVKPILRGKIDVYSYDNKLVIGSDEKGQFALSKKTSNAAEAVKNQQSNARAFNVVFQDCQDVRAEAQNVLITKESILKLVRSYHDCLGLSYTEAKAIKEKRIIDVGFFAGLYLPSLSLVPWTNGKKDDTYEWKFQNASSATFGFTALIGPRSLSPILTFQTGLAYAKGEHQGRFTYSGTQGGSPAQQTRIFEVDYSKLSVTAGARFSLRSNVLNPYIGLGFNYHRFLSLNQKQLIITTIGSSVEQEESPLGMREFSVGSYLAAGLRKKIGTKALFAECNFEKSYIDVDDPGQMAKLTAISLRFGFLF